MTKELFEKYLKIQKSGKYNMFTEAFRVIKLMKCDKETYKDLLFNFEKYNKEYGTVGKTS